VPCGPDCLVGSGIQNYGSLTLTKSTVSDNTVIEKSAGCGCGDEDVKGGGIYIDGGSVSLTNSAVSGNKAQEGGGIYIDGGSVSLTNSAVTENAAAYDGGGIYNYGDSVTLTNSAVSRNTAQDGGGIYNAGSSLEPETAFSVTLNGSSSVTENTASEHGGISTNAEGALLIYAQGWSGTVSGNIADDIFTFVVPT